MSNSGKYTEIFDYLAAPNLPATPEAAVVFGRNDPLVAYAVGDLIIPGLVSTAVISGGIGKDTGDLLARGFRSEAHFLSSELEKDSVERNYVLPRITLDEAATNGGENARHSLRILLNQGAGIESVTAVTHATSTRRLSETLKFEADKLSTEQVTVHRVPTKYAFDPQNPADREEAAAELLRLWNWPQKGLLGPQPDLPENLVDFVQDTHGNAPQPIKPWQSNLLRRLPKGARLHVINFAAKHGRK